MGKTRILVICGDGREAQTLRSYLVEQGYEVAVHDDLHDLTHLKNLPSPQLILADVGRNSGGAASLVTAVRAQSQVPVLVLSASNELTERLASFEAGADDFLMKPFEPRELLLRAQAILRRVPGAGVRPHLAIESEAREWRFKGLTVQSNRRRVVLDGNQVELTTAEFDLLRLLVTNSQHVLSREVILDQLRGIEWEAVDRSIDILVSRLRDKLGDDPRRPRFIRTVRSVGYQFVGELLEGEGRGTDQEQSVSV